MTKPIGDRMPEEVVQAFDGRDLDRKIGPAYVLVTVDPSGAPRPCMLSAGEILAVDDRRLRVALWPKTHTVQNLEAGGPILFCYVAPDTVVYVRGRARSLGQDDATKLVRFEIEVESVESDTHAGMPVTQTITFSIGSADPAEIVRSWDRQVESLRNV
ncbi:MAG: hypothetical protein ACRDGK_09885 [Actinomycetota bacterium]